MRRTSLTGRLRRPIVSLYRGASNSCTQHWTHPVSSVKIWKKGRKATMSGHMARQPYCQFPGKNFSCICLPWTCCIFKSSPPFPKPNFFIPITKLKFFISTSPDHLVEDCTDLWSDAKGVWNYGGRFIESSAPSDSSHVNNLAKNQVRSVRRTLSLNKNVN